jgi:hypothetical protein
VDIFLLDVGVLEDLLDGLESLAEEINVDFFELGAGESLGEVVAVLEGFDFETNALLGGECSLGLFDFTLEFAESTEVGRNVCASLLLVNLDEVVNDAVIEIFSSEMGITGCSEDFEDTVVDGEEGDIEGSTTEIVDDDLGFTALLVESVGDGGGGRFVDDAEDVEACDGTGVLGSLTLSVVEVGGDGDDGVSDFFAEVGFGGLLHLCEDHSGDLSQASANVREARRRRQTSSGVNSLSSPLCLTLIIGFPPLLVSLNGQCLTSRLTSASSYLRPMRRLASKTVFSGLVWKAFFAASPILRTRALDTCYGEEKDGLTIAPPRRRRPMRE